VYARPDRARKACRFKRLGNRNISGQSGAFGFETEGQTMVIAELARYSVNVSGVLPCSAGDQGAGENVERRNEVGAVSVLELQRDALVCELSPVIVAVTVEGECASPQRDSGVKLSVVEPAGGRLRERQPICGALEVTASVGHVCGIGLGVGLHERERVRRRFRCQPVEELLRGVQVAPSEVADRGRENEEHGRRPRIRASRGVEALVERVEPGVSVRR
jgi:hypothetical protein